MGRQSPVGTKPEKNTIITIEVERPNKNTRITIEVERPEKNTIITIEVERQTVFESRS